MRQSILTILIFSLFVSAHLQAQSYKEKDFIHYTTKDGLSDNFVYCLQQDDEGYIWVGTEAGLNRFDGNSFRSYYQSSAKLPVLSSNIFKLKKFGNGTIGIISKGGFQLLDTKKFSLTNYLIPDSTAFSFYRNSTFDAVLLPDQTVLQTTNTGFYLYDKNARLSYSHEVFHPGDAGNKIIRWGREIFSLQGKECLVYSQEKDVSAFNLATRSVRLIEDKKDPLFSFHEPFIANYYITKYQVNDHQFIFLLHLQDSIVVYDHATGKKISSSLPFSAQKEFNWEARILQMNDTLFAINGRNSGFYLFHLDKQTGSISWQTQKFLPGYKILALFLDKDKRLWAATTTGLLQQKINQPQFTNYHYAAETAMSGSIGGFKDAYRYKDKLYLGLWARNNGLLIIDTATMKVEKAIQFYEANSDWNQVISIEMYHPDTLWVGTSNGLVWFDTRSYHYGKVMDEKKFPQYNWSSAELGAPQKDGYAWICFYLGDAVVRYHIPSHRFDFFTLESKPALPFGNVKNLVADTNGDIWISGHGLARWNNKKQDFDTLIKVYGGLNKFNDNITNISADENGSLWLHNANNSLLEYRIAEKKFIAYTIKEGIPSENLDGFSPVIDNQLWIGTNEQLFRFDTKTKKVVLYDRDDGLSEYRSTSSGMYYDSASRHFYMLCNSDLVKIPIHPASRIDNSGNLLFRELLINDKKIIFNPGDNIRLKHTEKNFSLSFTIIDFEESNNYQFFYKLNSAENWTNLGTQRSITLTDLPSGNYSIHLKAINRSGEERSREFSFRISPPFWKTWWFILLSIVLTVFCLYSLYRLRVSNIRKKANIEIQLAELEIKGLHAQMNPHFIFNSLNSIKEMVLEDQKQNASRYLSKFAQLIRTNLEQSRLAFITVKQCIDHLQQYLDMEQLRFADFYYSLQINPDLPIDDIRMAPMLLQPLVENAIWHGLRNQAGEKNLILRFYQAGEQLVCEVEDNGIGIKESMKNKAGLRPAHQSMGIDNVYERLAVLNEKYKMNCSLTITDKSDVTGMTGSGTVALLRLTI